MVGAWGRNRKEMQREGLDAHQSLDCWDCLAIVLLVIITVYERVIKSYSLEDERRLRQGRTEAPQTTDNQL